MGFDYKYLRKMLMKGFFSDEDTGESDSLCILISQLLQNKKCVKFNILLLLNSKKCVVPIVVPLVPLIPLIPLNFNCSRQALQGSWQSERQR